MLNTPNGIAFPLVGGTRLLRHDPWIDWGMNYISKPATM